MKNSPCNSYCNNASLFIINVLKERTRKGLRKKRRRKGERVSAAGGAWGIADAGVFLCHASQSAGSAAAVRLD